MPVTEGGFERSRKAGFYDKNPGADLPIEQLNRLEPTKNSKGLRLGRLPEIRNIIQEEFERALAGDQGAQVAMDNAASRGSRVLREFERTARS